MAEKPEKQGIVHNVPKIESWRVPSVSYRGQTRDYEVVGEMTPAMTQEKLVKKYGIEIPSVPLIWAISSQAYALRDVNLGDAEELKNFLSAGFRQYPNTSTRIVYNPSGNDLVVHSSGTSREYSLDAEVVGSDGFMGDIPDKKVLESLLGTSDVENINEVANWINGTNAFLWRLNSKPKQKVERVAGFDADSGGLDLDCDRDPLSECPAFRVLEVE